MQVNLPASSRRATLANAFTPWRSGQCPIDRYFAEAHAARAFYARVQYAAHREGAFLTDDDLRMLGEMVFLRHVTALEDYLKQVIGACVSKLPCCQEHSARQLIPLYSVFSYSREEVGLGLLEGKSLADSGDLCNRFQTYLDARLKSADLGTLWDDLDVVLQLRHSLVHNLGVLTAHDSQKVGARDKVGQRLNIDPNILADCVEVIDRTVRAVNQTVLDIIEARWWTNRRLSGEPKFDMEPFTKLLSIFWSSNDLGPCDIDVVYEQSRSTWTQRLSKGQGA